MKHNLKKISTKVWQPILTKLDRKLDAACLKRDAYLSKVLSVELEHLDSELVFTNSDAAYSFISARLERLKPRTPVSLSLDEAVVHRLNDICSKKNVVRDAFINRLLLLLSVGPRTIDRLFFGSEEDDWRKIVWEELKHDGPFFENTLYPLEHSIDPLWAIREGINLYEGTDGLIEHVLPGSNTVSYVQKNLQGQLYPRRGIYTDLFLDKQFKNADLYGLNCFIADWQIPGHPAEVEYEKSIDDLLLELGDA